MKVHEKIKEARKLLNLSQADFAKYVGVLQKDVSLIENGKKEFIPNKYIEFFVKKNIDINSFYNDADKVTFNSFYNDTKNTEKLKKKVDKNVEIFETKPKVQKTPPFSGQNLKYSKPSKKNSVAEPIPFYDVDFVAGEEIHTFDTQISVPDDYYYISELNGCTAFRAYSDSMEKLIKNGATLFATNIENWFEHLEYGNIYGIVCNDGRKYLKYIRRAKKDVLKYLLRSENEDYDDFDIPKSEIRSIWLIHAWINRKA